jgi:hypothetical protein
MNRSLMLLEAYFYVIPKQHQLRQLQLSEKPVRGLGLDINRISSDMLAFSEQGTFPAPMCSAIRHYLQLEKVLKQLHRELTVRAQLCENSSSILLQIRYDQLKQELEFVYARRARLLKELHRLSCSVNAQVLLQTKSPLLCVEDLQLTARGGLAKAILNMPDEIDLYKRTILLVFHLTGVVVTLRRVDPRNTSQGVHVECPADPPGKLRRFRDAYDLVPCSVCGVLVNTHYNAACLIRDKGLFHHSHISSPSLSALPGVGSSSTSGG